MSKTKEKTGDLIGIGEFNLGVARFNYFKCVDCGSQFPEINNHVKCNGAIITLCPWCRPDTEQWKNGRGL